jgi:hypothetical protein
MAKLRGTAENGKRIVGQEIGISVFGSSSCGEILMSQYRPPAPKPAQHAHLGFSSNKRAKKKFAAGAARFTPGWVPTELVGQSAPVNETLQ